MSRYYSYLNSAIQLLGKYRGDEPFSLFLKKHFSTNKKYGSKDRKSISHLCYCYFRLGKAVAEMPVEERIIAGLFLCSLTSNELLQHLRPDLDPHAALPLSKKILLLDSSFSVNDIFPWGNEFSEGIDYEKFCAAFFIQPDLFLRLRPGNQERVMAKLRQQEIVFETINESCIAVANSLKVDTIIKLNKEAVIQDYSSQQVGKLLAQVKKETVFRVWDCCAASGGKSIMAKDILEDIDLTVSDIRESILYNLKQRFAEAGIKQYKSFVADLTASGSQPAKQQYDLIIADVPCSGSGTWSRTPEQLYFFDAQKIDEYSLLQKKITSAIIPSLRPGGFLLYITCSVFKKENEFVVEYIKEKYGLAEVEKKSMTGYDKRADTLFASLLQKPL
ncbi:MAG: Fmu (Sun) domain-containing protein [Chitinophagaceae bacterium]